MRGGKKRKEKRKRIEGGDIQRVEGRARRKMGKVCILGVVKKINK